MLVELFAVASLLFILLTFLMERDETMKESELSRKVISFCQSMNAVVFNVHGHKMQCAGVPDLFVMHNKLTNKGVWLELKVGTNQLSAIQKHTMREFQQRGQITVVLRYRSAADICAQYRIENIGGDVLATAASIRELWPEILQL